MKFMSVSTSHKISNYYDYFRDKEVVFTKANIKFLRMDPRQIYVKCNGGQWPCILNSSSLQMAKIIIGTSSGIYQEINKNKNANFSLRYCFFDSSNQPVQFFVNCNVYEVKSYNGTKELAVVTLAFTQRPPDDLISRIGEFLEVNKNFETRKEERIVINKNTLRELGIPKEESFVFVADVPRKCILKDISFGGARILTVGIPKFLENKPIDLRLIFVDTNEKISIPGIVKSAEFLPERKDIVIVHIQFNAETVPMTYKFKINSYITSYQKQMIDNQMLNEQVAKRAAELAAQKEAAAKAAQAQAAEAQKANSITQAVKDKAAEVQQKVAEVQQKVADVKQEVKTDIENKKMAVELAVEEKIMDAKASAEKKEESN